MAGSKGMKSDRLSKLVKPTIRKKRTTATLKNHRFQPFSERIAKLKIDPIRRKRGLEEREVISEDSATYTGRSLEKWKDLNMSCTFTAFVKEITPFCDNLASVLHNEDKIMKLLVTYIEKEDALAMEPLLDLMSQFAHDLDVRFEKHLEQAVSSITLVAAKHMDPAVIEWSFTCLAWLFKYLSRLLTEDLRPLYDLMSPYLGKQIQKPFIIRFAAESLSFLIRKAAAIYTRDSSPLDKIVSHILDDCSEFSNDHCSNLYTQGAMTLFSEAIKGVQGNVHSSGAATIQSLLKHSSQRASIDSWTARDILVGILTSLIHHTNAETFQPIIECILGLGVSVESSNDNLVCFSGDMIFTVVAVRKGTRVTKWRHLVEILTSLIEKNTFGNDVKESVASSLLGALAVVLQYAPMDSVLPALKTLDTIRNGVWTKYFLRFCDIFSRLGRERFVQFALPQLQKFILDFWTNYETELCVLLPHILICGIDKSLKCPKGFQIALLEQLQLLDWSAPADIRNSEEMMTAAATVLIALPSFSLDAEVQESFHNVIFKIVNRAVTSLKDHAMKDSMKQFTLGICLERLLTNNSNTDQLLSLWPALCYASQSALEYPVYWNNILRYIRLCRPDASKSGMHVDTMLSVAVKALSSSSHIIRQSCLEIIQELYQSQNQDVPEALTIANAIESTNICLESVRAISMNIRRLVPAYMAVATSDGLMCRAIPTYCFGLLHLKLAPAWEDVLNVLAEICKSSKGEETIVNLVQTWLGVTSGSVQNNSLVSVLSMDSDGFNVVSDFECSNLAKTSAIMQQVFKESFGGHPSAKELLFRNQGPILESTTMVRTQALRVLNKIPQVAEKRSRMLVPVLLNWAGNMNLSGEDEMDSGERWTRKEQKAMLAIFAQFTNPKVLYKSHEVYDSLLNLCANGDPEIQQSALKAIFAWREESIIRYQEHLTNLLDEARFREEISIFLRPYTDEEGIRREDMLKLMPVLLRLLYGRAIAGGKHGQSTRRKAIFVALSSLDQDLLGSFIDIALISIPESRSANCLQSIDVVQPKVQLRQQLGMLNMIHEMLQTIGSDLEPHARKILRAVLVCTVAASRHIDRVSGGEIPEDNSLLRSVRHVGIQCLVQIYSTMEKLKFLEEAAAIVEYIVQPRLANFAAENTQSVSGILRLFSAWAASSENAQYLDQAEAHILSHVALLLREPAAKDEVRLFILKNILDSLLQEKNKQIVLIPYVSAFVQSISTVLTQQPSRDVLDACVNTFTMLAGLITNEEEAEASIKVCSELLTKPNKDVPPKSKVGLLKTILSLRDLTNVPPTTELLDAVSGLFSRLTSQDSRSLLSKVMLKLSDHDDKMRAVAEICSDLNAFHKNRLNEPDHERQDRGFNEVYNNWHVFTVTQWLPIVHHSLFCIRDTEDMVNRARAAQILDRFIDAAQSDLENFKPVLSKVLMQSIERGMSNPSEQVRSEFLHLLGYVVNKLPHWQSVRDMTILTVGGDEEASVFTNILHIQQHRRLRALKRLGDDASHVSSANIFKFWLPLLEHFIFDQAEGEAGRTLADQTVLTIGALTASLSWSAFRTTFKRYLASITAKEELEKTVLRLIGALVDSLVFSSKSSQAETQKLEIITTEFLPPLMDYLHHKDESTVDRRMPVAISIVKLLMLLPKEEASVRLTATLTDICHILRSRSQEARDQTRKTLSAILVLLGPSYLGFILKELRAALQRGYQLHVLSFTVHSLLVNAAEVCQPGDIDHCLTDLISIIMDDVFGVTGQEKDAEEYKTSAKEVKSIKSPDTMELLARITPITKLGIIIQPLQALLCEKLDGSTMKKIDDLLTRLRKGIDQNPAAGSRETLMFCHELARQAYLENDTERAKHSREDYRVRRYLIQMEAANRSKSKFGAQTRTDKLMTFAISLTRKVIQRHEDLQTSANMRGFLPIIGDALVAGQEELRTAAMKLLATILKLPISELDQNVSIYFKQAVEIISASSSMTNTPCRAALELITAVLREKRFTTIRDIDIANVIKAIKSDIDEPDRQGIIYKFIRTVLTRKIVVTEVYELMDAVSNVMVTNADRNVRDSARSAYIQFILSYPQGQERWHKQMVFLLKNLEYRFPSGRQSVMEALHQLITKVPEQVYADLAPTVLAALVLMRIKDSDQDCCQMAEILIAKLFERAQKEQLEHFLALMHTWLDNAEKPAMQVAALRCWTTYLRARIAPNNCCESLRDKIVELLTIKDPQINPELLKAVLDTWTAMVETAPEIAFAGASFLIWSNVQKCFANPDYTIQEACANLIGAWFSHLASSAAKTDVGLTALPLCGSAGSKLDAAGMRELCRASLRTLMSISVDVPETLGNQTVRNLLFLGRCFVANAMPWREVDDRIVELNGDSEEERIAGKNNKSTALAYLLMQLSYIIRQDNFTISARSMALQCQTVLVNHCENFPNLRSLLRPLYILTDPTIKQPATDIQQGLVDKAHELLDSIRKKLGDELYIKALEGVQKDARMKREERRQKRKIEAVSAPAKVAKEKKRKHEAQKEKRKLKSSEARGKRRGW